MPKKFPLGKFVVLNKKNKLKSKNSFFH